MMTLGKLPKSLKLSDMEYPICADYRVALLILQAFNDVNLKEHEKYEIMIRSLFEEPEKVFELIQQNENAIKEVVEKCIWFLDCGKKWEQTAHQPKIMDWEQDEQMIFSAVNKVAGKETRECEYIHWWTFVGYMSEIDEGVFSTVVHIRKKRAKGKQLDKTETQFYNEHRDLIDLKTKYTEEEQKEIEEMMKIFE